MYGTENYKNKTKAKQQNMECFKLPNKTLSRLAQLETFSIN